MTANGDAARPKREIFLSSNLDLAGREERMVIEYTVGLRLGKHSEALTIEAEDALIAALRVKSENPEAMITYVRKSNRRGDRRHPHLGLSHKAAR
jgi:hypothetical protein